MKNTLFSLVKKLLGGQKPDWTFVKPLKNRLTFTYSFHTHKNTSWLFGPLTPCFYSPEEPSPRLLPPSVPGTPNSSIPSIHPTYLQHVSLTTSCPFSHPRFSRHWVQLAMLVGMLSHLLTAARLRVWWPRHVLKPACHPFFCPFMGALGLRYVLKAEHFLEEILILSTSICYESLL